MLKTETNTPEMANRICMAAWKKGLRHISLDFEHGQWWVTNTQTSAAWSVVDAEGGSAIDGFDFEQVSLGDED